VEPERFTLENGIRVVLLPLPESEDLSMFAFLPLGLANDGAGKTQWSHLLEHLATRSSGATMQQANAETLPDHMRIDFYGSAGEWKESIDRLARSLGDLSCTEDLLEGEKRKIEEECANTSQRQATHKFAIAAWNQAVRHGNTHPEIMGDVRKATCREIRDYGSAYLIRPGKMVICAIGGLDPAEFRAVLEEKIDGIVSGAGELPAAEPKSGTLEVTWDLPTRHVILSWPIPGVDDPAYPALFAASRLVPAHLYQDSRIRKTAGQVFAGADLFAPEGNRFYVNAVLLPGATFEEVERSLMDHIRRLRDPAPLSPQESLFPAQLAIQLTQVPDPEVAAYGAPGVSRRMVEANIGLQYGMQEFHLGAHRDAVAESLRRMKPKELAETVAKYLTDETLSVCRIGPAASPPE